MASDPRLGDFEALNDPVHRRRVERDGDYFVVEGALAIERLLDPAVRPRWSVRTIALLPRLADRLAGPLAALPAGVEVVVTDEATLRGVVGFDLHRGALASVARRPIPDAVDLVTPGALLVAAEGVNDHENLGALYRNAAAFGAAGVLVDPTTADPFYRRSVRVSLGHVLGVPTGALAGLPEGLDRLRAAGASIVALTTDGDTDVRALTVDRHHRALVVLVGAEGPGLTPAAVAGADHRVRIDLAPGVDSLNVATAAAVALHRLRG